MASPVKISFAFRTHFPWMSKVPHSHLRRGHNRIGKPSILAGNHQIKRPHQHQPASDDTALNLYHGWFGDISPSPTETEVHLLFIGPMPFDTGLTKPTPSPYRRLSQWLDLLDHDPKKSWPISCDHNDLALIILAGAIERVIHLVQHGLVLGVRLSGLASTTLATPLSTPRNG